MRDEFDDRYNREAREEQNRYRINRNEDDELSIKAKEKYDVECDLFEDNDQ